MSAETYFYEQGLDLYSFNLLARCPSYDPRTDEVLKQFQATANLYNIAPVFNEDPLSKLGDAIRQAVEASVSFGEDLREKGFAVCGLAESKLLASLEKSTIALKDGFAPVIVVDRENNPLAFVKPSGEKTAYALVDDYAKGLVAGTFADYVNPRFEPNYYDQKTGVTVIRMGHYDHFSPVRFSAFISPPEARKRIAQPPNNAKILPTISHESIVQKITQILQDRT